MWQQISSFGHFEIIVLGLSIYLAQWPMFALNMYSHFFKQISVRMLDSLYNARLC